MKGPFDTAGRTTAVTIFTPVPRRWAAWLKGDFAAVGLLRGILRQSAPSRPVKKLSFISFAHWALIDQIPARGGRRAKRLPYPYIVFQSNFNGAPHEYIEAFSRGLLMRMRGLWKGAYGVPDPKNLPAFQAYIQDQWIPCDHYYAAYPQASTKMVLAALELRAHFDRFSARTKEIKDPHVFAAEYERFVADVQGFI